MTTFLTYALIAASAYGLSLIDMYRGRAKPQPATRRCGFNAGLPDHCRRHATMSFPIEIEDGRTGHFYLCGYHSGAVITTLLEEKEV